MCHGYAHGNGIKTKYPLLNYFEISIILGEIIPRIYSIFCEEYKVDSIIEKIDVVERINMEFSFLKKQYENRSVEHFEMEQNK